MQIALVGLLAVTMVGVQDVQAVEVPEPGVYYVNNMLSLDARGNCIGAVHASYRLLEVDYAFRMNYDADSTCRVRPTWERWHPLQEMPRIGAYKMTIGSDGWLLRAGST